MTQTTGFRVADLPQNSATAFDMSPDAETRAALAAELDLTALRKLRFTGRIESHGVRDWVLTGTLGATVVQPCVVTLDPVTTRIDTQVRRLYLASLPEPGGAETEMPEDESQERLGAVIDPAAVMAEELALNIPAYPRKTEADLGESVFTEPGKKPMTDEDTKPFADLAGLRAELKKDI